MILPATLDRRPVIVALAGPNGAGKSTFYEVFLRSSGLRFVNADELARNLELGPYEAAAAAEAVRQELVRQRESFIFETVFSDPAGAKLDFLQEAAASGYNVVLCYIGLSAARKSEERVAMRVSQGGHDVPSGKLTARFPRTLANLKLALTELPLVLVFDNSDLAHPYRRVAEYVAGRPLFLAKPVPRWLRPLL